ncbi:MAG TPA: tRNA uridine-5-carboxymethylaminomethyl(34) synthesis GTPase MnmE, partial [Afifellaceae bacterium]|nr:tRNA uridine-5-carboxymethylaminomethyl(34) synthesis GTPase MnmE [Afifellaceae bacterium]
LRQLAPRSLHPAPDFAISAKTGQGLDSLQSALAAAAAEGSSPGADAALAALFDGAKPDEVAADLLRQATDEIGRLTGRVDVEEVLNRLFAEFCIGK